MKKSDPFKVRKSRGPVTNYSQVSKPQGRKALLALVNEALEIQARIENMKPLYGRLDELTSVLANADLTGTGVVVVDLFAKKSSNWKSVCFRRYELSVGGK